MRKLFENDISNTSKNIITELNKFTLSEESENNLESILMDLVNNYTDFNTVSDIARLLAPDESTLSYILSELEYRDSNGEIDQFYIDELINQEIIYPIYTKLSDMQEKNIIDDDIDIHNDIISELEQVGHMTDPVYTGLHNLGYEHDPNKDLYTKLGVFDEIHENIEHYLNILELDYDVSNSWNPGNFRSIYIKGFVSPEVLDELLELGYTQDELEEALDTYEYEDTLEDYGLDKMRIGNHLNSNMSYLDKVYSNDDILDWENKIKSDIDKYRANLLDVTKSFLEERKGE